MWQDIKPVNCYSIILLSMGILDLTRPHPLNVITFIFDVDIVKLNFCVTTIHDIWISFCMSILNLVLPQQWFYSIRYFILGNTELLSCKFLIHSLVIVSNTLGGMMHPCRSYKYWKNMITFYWSNRRPQTNG